MKGKRNIPKVPKIAKVVAKKPPTVPKVAKTAKASLKKPPTVPKVAKTAKASLKKPKINVSCGGMFCIGLSCGSKVVDVYDPTQEPKVTEPVKGDIKPKDVLEDVVLEDVVLEDVERTNIVSNISNILNNLKFKKDEKVIITEGYYSLYYKNTDLFWKYKNKNKGYEIKIQIRDYDDVNFIHDHHRNKVISLLQKANEEANEKANGKNVGLMGIFRKNMVAPNPVDNHGGKKNTTVYKLNGDKVLLIHNNRKIKRSIYIKGNGKTKYCKINKVFISLSKLKNKIIE
jgi:hypothetical protein